MTPAGTTRVWRKTRRQARRGVPTGRRATHPVRTAYGRHQQDSNRQATFAAANTARREPDTGQAAIKRARIAWLTASRDTELDRWNDLYDLAVPRPRPGDGSTA